MHDTSIAIRLIEVHEPAFPRRGFDISALMRRLDIRRALLQHRSILVGPVYCFRSKDRLRAIAHSAKWRKDVVPPIALDQLRSFERGQIFWIFDDHFAVIENM